MEATDIPGLPRGVRLHFDKIRATWVLLAPGRAVTLDQIGHAILSEIDGTTDFGRIVATLAEKYSAPEAQIAGDAGEYIRGLADRRILDIHE